MNNLMVKNYIFSFSSDTTRHTTQKNVFFTQRKVVNSSNASRCLLSLKDLPKPIKHYFWCYVNMSVYIKDSAHYILLSLLIYFPSLPGCGVSFSHFFIYFFSVRIHRTHFFFLQVSSTISFSLMKTVLKERIFFCLHFLSYNILSC